jgi:hypothetical protein
MKKINLIINKKEQRLKGKKKRKRKGRKKGD